MTKEDAEVTALLKQLGEQSGGANKAAVEKILPVLYDELRRIARGQLGRGRGGAETLEPTALVHEAFLRLIDQRVMNWQNRGHFLGIAAQMMRRIAVDHARARKAAKRGGGAERVTLLTNIPDGGDDTPDILALDTALTQLAAASERQARIVELRYFGGMSLEETAASLDISTATVKREWTVARAFLLRELRSEE